jgi:hypothetical protein
MNGVIKSLRAGRANVHMTTGESMQPKIRSGQRQILVQVLTAGEAALLGAETRSARWNCREGRAGTLIFPIEPIAIEPSGDARDEITGRTIQVDWRQATIQEG